MRILIFILTIQLVCLSARSEEPDYGQPVCENYKVLDQTLRAQTTLSLGSGCGPGGYLLGFGYSYCSLFIQHESIFSYRGQAVLRNIRTCLMHDLLASETPLTCENVEDIAINSHFGCYMHSGYCEMPKRDKALVIYYLIGQMMNSRSRAEFFRITRACAAQGLN
jgi:hypothetical protein